jgi:hypothetical protein
MYATVISIADGNDSGVNREATEARDLEKMRVVECPHELRERGFGDPVIPSTRNCALAKTIELHVTAGSELDTEGRASDAQTTPTLLIGELYRVQGRHRPGARDARKTSREQKKN